MCSHGLVVEADEETHVASWGLPSYNDALEPCSECMADREHRPYTDLSRGALWRPTERMPLVAYMIRFREPLHPLVTSGFMSRWLMFLDLMHLMDCKGVSAITYGGVMAFLKVDGRLGNNIATRMRNINTAMRGWYERNPGHNNYKRFSCRR